MRLLLFSEAILSLSHTAGRMRAYHHCRSALPPLPHSSILDPPSSEPAEPLLAMPDASISKPLLLLLHVLLAPEPDVQRWVSLEQAMEEAMHGRAADLHLDGGSGRGAAAMPHGLAGSSRAGLSSASGAAPCPETTRPVVEPPLLAHAVPLVGLPPSTMTPAFKHALAAAVRQRLRQYEDDGSDTVTSVAAALVFSSASAVAVAATAARQAAGLLRRSETKVLEEVLGVMV